MKGSFKAAGQHQIILGTGFVDKVYAQLMEIANFQEGELKTKAEATAGNMNWFQKASRLLGDVFLPIIPILVATGLFMGVRSLITNLGVTLDPTALTLSQVLIDTAFAFLPALVTYSVMKKFGGSPALGIVIGLMLVAPQLPNANQVAAGNVEPIYLSLGALSVPIVGYQGSVLPALVLGIIAAKIEKALKKVVPDVLDLIVTPFVTLLCSMVIGLIVIGPIMHVVEQGLLIGVQALMNIPFGVGGFIVGALQQVVVITGRHHTFKTLEIELLANTGANPFNTLTCGAIVAQCGAAVAAALKLKDATIDQPHASDTTTRGMAAIDIQGSGDVEIKVEGNNTLNGSGNSAGIQKNDDVSTGKLTITAKDKDQTLNVNADVRGAAIGGSGWGWNEGSNSQHGTKNIEINGGTVNTQGRIGSGYKGGAAENIVITGDAVVNANGGIGGGTDEGYEGNEGRQTSITISGNAQVNATYKVDTGSDYGYKYGFGGSDAGLAVIGGGVGSSSKKSHAKVTIQGNAQVTAENRAYGGGAGIGGGANGTGEVIIGGKAQVKATGSAEHHGSWENNGAGAAIGDGGTTAGSSGSVQNGENKFTTDKSIQDGAKVEMTNIGHNGSNTVTQTRQNGDWVTKCSNHEFVETIVAPTCTESGYTVSKCTRCGKETGEHTNIVAPLGHEYKNGVCIRCGAPEPQENGGSSSPAPNYTVTGAETYETSVVDGRYIIAVPSEDAALNAVLGDLRAIKAQGADVVVFRTRSRESSLVINEMLAMGTDVTPFVLAHNGGEAQLTINGAVHNELIH